MISLKLGVSSYSLSQYIESGKMDLPQAIRWIAEQGGQHVEIVPTSSLKPLMTDDQFIAEVRRAAEESGVVLSNYAVGGNFANRNEEELQQEIKRLKDQVDIAHSLGIRLMRHDAARRPVDQCSINHFEDDLPAIAKGCAAVADYAAQFGITTSVENHGYYTQHSDRVLRLLHTVNRPNYKTTVDVGNFLCVDEDPHIAVAKMIPYASMIHIKDFYYKKRCNHPGEGWFSTLYGNYLRGAIAGEGYIDMHHILATIKHSGYDGFLSIEFEGMEDCLRGVKMALDNIRRIWDEVQ